MMQIVFFFITDLTVFFLNGLVNTLKLNYKICTKIVILILKRRIIDLRENNEIF